MALRKFALPKVYGLLEPGPVVLLATAQRGRHNVMPMSWHTMLEFEPPLVGCVVSGRNFSFTALRATRECTINIPGADMARTVVRCGNTSGRRTDKFKTFGLTALAASKVKAPLIAQCHANLECRVVDTRLVNRYNFLRARGGCGVDRFLAQGCAQAAPPRLGRFHGRRRHDPAALGQEMIEPAHVAKMRHATRTGPPWICN